MQTKPKLATAVHFFRVPVDHEYCTTSHTSGLAVVHGFMHTFHRCIHFSPVMNGLLSILISVALNGEDASKLHLEKNVQSVQLASKSTNLRPGTQKTFGRKNTELCSCHGLV